MQAFHDACAARGVAVPKDVADALGASEGSGELALSGAALPESTAAPLADVMGPGALARCGHLNGACTLVCVFGGGWVGMWLPGVDRHSVLVAISCCRPRCP